MATSSATTIDLNNGNVNRLEIAGATEELFNYTDASVSTADTVTLTTKIREVVAIVGLPPTWTWSQSGNTITITVADATALAIDCDFSVIGKSV